MGVVDVKSWLSCSVYSFCKVVVAVVVVAVGVAAVVNMLMT